MLTIQSVLQTTTKSTKINMQKLVKFDDFILKQTVNCIKGGTHEVVLPEELVESKLDYNALPLTINAMCLIGKKENENYICYEDAITDSALTLIGRFTPYDNGIKNLCNDLATWEQNKLPSCMVCEFGHVTTYEDCNIMSRDIDRKYILPYLNHASPLLPCSSPPAYRPDGTRRHEPGVSNVTMVKTQ